MSQLFLLIKTSSICLNVIDFVKCGAKKPFEVFLSHVEALKEEVGRKTRTDKGPVIRLMNKQTSWVVASNNC